MCKAVVILPSVIDTSRLDENFGENVTSNCCLQVLASPLPWGSGGGQWRWAVQQVCMFCLLFMHCQNVVQMRSMQPRVGSRAVRIGPTPFPDRR